ncbi:MAG: hypothetical protein ABGZ35_08425, partial [Planctomycetaceae bacterium]
FCNAALRRRRRAAPALSVGLHFHWRELRSVFSTAASKARFQLQAVDATACTKNKQFKPAVCATSAG